MPGLSDVDYLAQSLYEPSAFIVPGFNPGMPVINKPPIGLTDEEILAVIAYLQSLGGKVTVTMSSKVWPLDAQAAGPAAGAQAPAAASAAAPGSAAGAAPAGERRRAAGDEPRPRARLPALAGRAPVVAALFVALGLRRVRGRSPGPVAAGSASTCCCASPS